MQEFELSANRPVRFTKMDERGSNTEPDRDKQQAIFSGGFEL